MGGFAWVTLATNDSYSLGALVLAHSLKQAGTTQQLVVIVTPGVSDAMRVKLSSVFNIVQEVNILDSKDEANLKLLQRPELGVTFTKLHCWRLTQFEKCVFLDADTLVLQNCDELFEREELSAAPDVGWPDCFNSGVFVYRPSNDTYEKLVSFALAKGSFDGGDQGLLNIYFSDWAHKDINKHLPFIYNMCSTACYSYLPAFKQFGADAKIVHFIGRSKPWLQYFDTRTGQVQPTGELHHLKAILQKWWDIFCAQVLGNLSADMTRRQSDAVHNSPSPKSSCSIYPERPFTRSDMATYDHRVVWDPWEELDRQSMIPHPQTSSSISQYPSEYTQTQHSESEPLESHNTNICYQTAVHHDVPFHNVSYTSHTLKHQPDPAEHSNLTVTPSHPHDCNVSRHHHEPNKHSFSPSSFPVAPEYSNTPQVLSSRTSPLPPSEYTQTQHSESESLESHNTNICYQTAVHHDVPFHNVSYTSHTVTHQPDPAEHPNLTITPSSHPHDCNFSPHRHEPDNHSFSPSSFPVAPEHSNNTPQVLLSRTSPQPPSTPLTTLHHEHLPPCPQISARPSSNPEIIHNITASLSDSQLDRNVNTDTFFTSDDQGNSHRGLAGAFSQLKIGEARSAEQAVLEDQLRRQGWEVGNIDYLGRDSFDNIWNKICQTLASGPEAAQPQPPQSQTATAPETAQPKVTKEPSPPKAETHPLPVEEAPSTEGKKSPPKDIIQAQTIAGSAPTTQETKDIQQSLPDSSQSSAVVVRPSQALVLSEVHKPPKQPEHPQPQLPPIPLPAPDLKLATPDSEMTPQVQSVQQVTTQPPSQIPLESPIILEKTDQAAKPVDSETKQEMTSQVQTSIQEVPDKLIPHATSEVKQDVTSPKLEASETSVQPVGKEVIQVTSEVPAQTSNVEVSQKHIQFAASEVTSQLPLQTTNIEKASEKPIDSEVKQQETSQIPAQTFKEEATQKPIQLADSEVQQVASQVPTEVSVKPEGVQQTKETLECSEKLSQIDQDKAGVEKQSAATIQEVKVETQLLTSPGQPDVPVETSSCIPETKAAQPASSTEQTVKQVAESVGEEKAAQPVSAATAKVSGAKAEQPAPSAEQTVKQATTVAESVSEEKATQPAAPAAAAKISGAKAAQPDPSAEQTVKETTTVVESARKEKAAQAAPAATEKISEAKTPQAAPSTEQTVKQVTTVAESVSQEKAAQPDPVAIAKDQLETTTSMQCPVPPHAEPQAVAQQQPQPIIGAEGKAEATKQAESMSSQKEGEATACSKTSSKGPKEKAKKKTESQKSVETAKSQPTECPAKPKQESQPQDTQAAQKQTESSGAAAVSTPTPPPRKGNGAAKKGGKSKK